MYVYVIGDQYNCSECVLAYIHVFNELNYACNATHVFLYLHNIRVNFQTRSACIYVCGHLRACLCIYVGMYHVHMHATATAMATATASVSFCITHIEAYM
jgi:hypothetical protein